MLNWDFGIILNNMVPKEELDDLSALDCFWIILNNMVPKVNNIDKLFNISFEIILNNMVPKFRELFQSIKKRFWNHFKYHVTKNKKTSRCIEIVNMLPNAQDLD